MSASEDELEPELSGTGRDYVSLAGALSKNCPTTNEGCFTRYHLPEESLELIRVLFPEGRSQYLQKALGDSLAQSPLIDIVGDVMLQVLESHMTDADRACCLTEKRGPSYYMFCDDEELEHDEHGRPDGNMKIRRRCDSWRLVVLAHGTGCFVEFGGSDADEWALEGWWADEGKPLERIYRDDESGFEIQPVTPELAEKAKMLHEFAEKFGGAMSVTDWTT